MITDERIVNRISYQQFHFLIISTEQSIDFNKFSRVETLFRVLCEVRYLNLLEEPLCSCTHSIFYAKKDSIKDNCKISRTN